MNQKEATYAAIINVCGEQDEAYTPSKEQRSQVNQILFEGFRAGTITVEREFTDTELKAYVSGLQSNWLRKDSRLNGNVKYTAKNPGSRQGSGDAQLKAMRALFTTLTSETDKAEVQACIDARVAEIAQAKVKTIDFSSLPESLKAKFSK
jgi:hypothetical protein